MIIEVCIGFVVIIFIAFIWENFKARKGPPGPIRFPVLGTLPQIASISPISFIALDELSKRYGDIMGIQMGSVDAVVLSSIQAVKALFNKEETLGRQCEGIWWERNLKQNIGLGFSNGEAWEITRKFCKDSLKEYGFSNRVKMEGLLHEELEVMMNLMEKERTLHPKHIIHFKSSYFHACFTNLMCTLIMGKRHSYDDEEFILLMKHSEDFVKNGVFGAGLLTAFPFLRYVIPEQLGYTTQINAIYGIYKIAKDLLDHNRTGPYDTNPQCLTDSFLKQIDEDSSKHKPFFTEDQFKVTFHDIMAGGSETTSNFVNFTLLHLTSNEKIQEKLCQEIVNVCGLDRVPTLEDKPKMIYTQAVLLEGSRWARTLVHGIPKKITRDFQYRNYTFRKGTVLMMNTHSIFFDKKFWGDPDTFRPERFIDESGKLIPEKTERIIAFGVGRRNCFGEMLARDTSFIFITTLLQKFSFKLSDDEPKACLDPVMGITLSPHPYDAVVELRQEH